MFIAVQHFRTDIISQISNEVPIRILGYTVLESGSNAVSIRTSVQSTRHNTYFLFFGDSEILARKSELIRISTTHRLILLFDQK